MATNAEFKRPVADTRIETQPGRTSAEPTPEPSTQVDERSWARKRVEKKHKFRGDVVAYVVVNAFLIGIWAFNGQGYFWPGWVLAGWGVGLLLDAWNLFFRRPINDADVDRELHRLR
jgi:hypothetical protein